MDNYLQPGEILPFTTPGGGVVAGLGYKIGSLVVLATVTVTAAQVTADPTIKFSAMVSGTATVVKEGAGSGQVWSEGLKIYWDNSAKKFTITSAGNTLVGVAAQAALTAATTGVLRLDGVVR
jgi:predicted RecA/RadA family phage recombinase